MCPPDHLTVAYEINPWMDRAVAVDRDRARYQWDELVGSLVAAGAEVATVDAVPGLPDMVFSANAGVVDTRRFVPSHFRHPQRQGETEHWRAWFAAAGYEVCDLPATAVHEGAGDAISFGGVLVSGYRTRSDAAAHLHLSRELGVAVRPVELVDPRLYHLDLAFCPLDDRRAMVAPAAFDDYARKVLAELVPQPLELDVDEALAFAANSVVVGNRVVMARCPVRVGRVLESWGFDVVEVDVGEFLKAGGSCRCLTLDLEARIAP